MPDPRPNLLLILVDQWRADALGCAGHPVVETPHLDELFLDGFRFAQAYAAVPSCVAARCSLLTGLTPRSHGRVGYQDGVEWHYPVTLPGLLRDAGYHTQCVGKMHVHPPRARLGFDHVVLHDGVISWNRRHLPDWDAHDDYRLWLRERAGAGADVSDTGLAANSWVVRPWPYEESWHPTNWAVTQAIDFLRRRDPQQPFFLTLSLVRPHAPLDPPAAYLARYEHQALPPVPVGDWAEPDDPHGYGLRATFAGGIVAPEARDRCRRAYFAQLTHLDHQLNRLFLQLSWLNLAENTAVVFVADHGELLGDHHLWGKSLPFDGSARVPLLLRLPWRYQLGGRRVIDAPVELRDLLPTLCELAEAPVPDSIEGRSLLPLCRGEATHWRRWVHGEHVRGPQLSVHWLTDGREKYVWYSDAGRELLFDLVADASESRNLAVECPERVALWRGRLAAELTGREEGYVAGGELVTGRPVRAVLSHVAS